MPKTATKKPVKKESSLRVAAKANPRARKSEPSKSAIEIPERKPALSPEMRVEVLDAVFTELKNQIVDMQLGSNIDVQRIAAAVETICRYGEKTHTCDSGCTGHEAYRLARKYIKEVVLFPPEKR